MSSLGGFLVSSCLLLVSGSANTSVTDVSVTTVLASTNSTDSWKDALNTSTSPSSILPNDSMSLTAPIFLTPTPSPRTPSPIYDSDGNDTWETTSTNSTPTDYFNPYPGYFLPTTGTTNQSRSNITLFPTDTLNQSRPLPTTSYVSMTPPPTPTSDPAISTMNPSPVSSEMPPATTPETQETSGACPHAARHVGMDASYFRLLLTLYLATFVLFLIYIMQD